MDSDVERPLPGCHGLSPGRRTGWPGATVTVNMTVTVLGPGRGRPRAKPNLTRSHGPNRLGWGGASEPDGMQPRARRASVLPH
jgi:hypothetical protein